MNITKEQASLIQGALDSMGVALTNHGHEWSAGERAVYEEATAALTRGSGNDGGRCQRCGNYLGGPATGAGDICCCAPEDDVQQ